ncbi:hypothetical protein EPUS_02133 [Endocarpon pusillum Z07020]|uniref:Cytochrome P450 n=1 Tax=Endocarpon pusillum (strain Z07020 / HMAS-L-300199) TaxID=1263415 RepID=U1GK68_ENDPU|nr:uncharacterized protein EPUS_02133 [Endocarpon pusillum Z07020]ERF72246.1 hypothetical protein EPUS_02133 [Endocarpon pusillum Z07020]
MALNGISLESNESGYLVRIAPNEVAWSDPEAVSTIYRTKTIFTKTDYYDAWASPNKRDVGHFPARHEKEHSERRRIVNNIYSVSSILESEEATDSCTQLFYATIRDFTKQSPVVDLCLRINMYAFDVLGELFYGKMFGFMSECTDIDCTLYLQSLFSPSVRGTLGAVKHIENASEAAVKRRKQEIEEHKDDKSDMLRKMLEINAD